MFHWFNENGCAQMYVDAAEHASVHLAVQDLQQDVKKVCGQSALFKRYLPTTEKGAVVIGSLENAAFAAWAAPYVDTAALQTEWEGYRIIITDEHLIVAGSDRRGAMWGVYRICRDVLGVDPCCRFTGAQPPRRSALALENAALAGKPETYRFRGWFLNDEDLLSDWKDGGGARFIDYPFYGQVAHPDGVDMVLETAVRLGINLMIPASFVDIHNPPEENLIRMVTRRGLYVTQHHVEPLGVSHFGFENYWRARGREEQFSFVTNRERVVECWRASVRKWARYEGVIWQLGLRGRGDRPAWYNDGAIADSDAAHGALISQALQTQHELVAQELGTEDFLSTATLWMEGTELFHKGLLRFPKDTVIVFADAGLTQMFGKDFFELPRMPEYRYGLYYHVAFWGAGPHLAQGTDLRKMQYQYRLALEKGDTFYSILNVANVRDVILCARANAEMVWDMGRFDETRFLNDYFRQMFGLENGAALMHGHFAAFADYPRVDGGDYDRFWQAQMELQQTDFKQKVILDGVARSYALTCLNDIQKDDCAAGKKDSWLPALEQGIRNFENSYAALAQAYRAVCPAGRPFFRDLMLVQEEIMLGLYHWALGCGRARQALAAGDRNGAKAALRHGVFALEKLLEDRRKAEHPPFENWYRGDTKMNLPRCLEKTRETLEMLEAQA